MRTRRVRRTSHAGTTRPMSRVVVVTGAGYGAGRAIAEEFGRRGDRVALLARGAESLEAAARAIRSSLAIPTDVADDEQVEAAAERTERELGPIDVWVNCALATVFAPFGDLTPAEFRRATDVTYLGYVWGTMSALRRMCPRDRGVVIQVGSALAYRSIPLQSPYCGAKHAINGFTDSVRTELLHDRSRVRITSVHLPALNTPQFEVALSKMPRRTQPVPPIYQPEVAARAVAWAADHDRRELWVGGSTVATILGNRLAPWLGDLYLARTGFEAQQAGEPAPPDRGDNLFGPVQGARGAHGRFDARAKPRSIQLVLAQHRDLLLTAGGLLASMFALRRR
jgi:NAD(P)-dependent dehydrogenase (short-subunit alcohol dehydrogenase family)